jgi:hypothetical protein
MRSSQEINEEKYEAKLKEMEHKRRQAIVDGLNRLDSLDTDKVAQELPKSAYVTAAHEGLKKILRTANLTEPE